MRRSGAGSGGHRWLEERIDEGSGGVPRRCSEEIPSFREPGGGPQGGQCGRGQCGRSCSPRPPPQAKGGGGKRPRRRRGRRRPPPSRRAAGRGRRAGANGAPPTSTGPAPSPPSPARARAPEAPLRAPSSLHGPSREGSSHTHTRSVKRSRATRQTLSDRQPRGSPDRQTDRLLWPGQTHPGSEIDGLFCFQFQKTSPNSEHPSGSSKPWKKTLEPKASAKTGQAQFASLHRAASSCIELHGPALSCTDLH